MYAPEASFAVVPTACILAAIQFEEHDLVREHGSRYEHHRRQVKMLVPFGRCRAGEASRSMANRVGTIGFLFFLFKGVLWLALPAWLYITR